MSRLKELRLHGFKTFADPTRFVFERGVNAVIGPNGSGKSNMADAVRWVLGEQSNRSLRTRRADDVIFAGSEGRRPHGMAEAVLTLDNADGWIPIEFAEVTIGRRAYRSGDSEYLLNGARVRLRDVSELLGEGRLGASELVVVGQGTVDAALSLRPDERRQLFEEAAGVKNLQVRKNEALARLAKARDNLTRVGDLIAELKPQVRRLALQAQHAQEHDALARRAHLLIAEWHRRRERAERDALGDARRRGAAAEAELAALRGQMAADRAAVESAETAYWRAEEAARSAASVREEAREALIRAESRLEALVAKADEQTRALTAAEHELAEVRESVSGSPEAADGAVDEAFERAGHAERGWQESIKALATADERLLAAEQALAACRRRESGRIADETRRSEERARREARRAQIESELAWAAASRAEAERLVTPARARLTEAGSALDAVRQAAVAAERDLGDGEPAAAAARSRAASLAERVGALRAELEALAERAEHGNRLGGLLAAAGWPPLLDALDAAEELWPAIEAAVGGELGQAVVWRDDELIGRLADARGAARLLAPHEAGAIGGRSEALAAVGADSTLAGRIGGEPPLLFHRVALAPDLASLLNGWRRLPAGWSAVTPAGDLADGRGLLILHGGGDVPGGETARQHARRRQLAEEAAALEKEQEAARVAAAQALARVGELGRAATAARDRLTAAEAGVRHATREVEAAEAGLDRARRREAELRSELGRLPAMPHATPSGTADRETVVELRSLEVEARAAREERERQAAQRDAARVAWQTAQAAAAEIEARSAGRRQQRAALLARLAHLESTVPAERQAVERITAERAASERSVASAQQVEAAASQARDAADAERDRRRSALLELERGGGSRSARLGELERAVQAAAIEVSRHEETLAALGRERALAVEGLPEPQPSSAAAPEDRAAGEELDDAALEVELRRARRTLAQIGSVNPFAVDEHRELAERLDGLTAQDTDLTTAIGSTEQLIARLEQEIAERFNAAFVAIGQRFDEFVKLLFAGGSASLQVSDGNDGEESGGIEIAVQPPGTRPQRLAMLSGGQRALTGVALLFAMLSVNPVPFCILDEVDAALDEANIGRFASALRRLAETIDFVVITHNRATIETADTIYGVTMTDAAVSRVISLRLADVAIEVGA